MNKKIFIIFVEVETGKKMQNYLYTFFLFLSFGFALTARAQQYEDWRKFVEQLAEDGMSETAIENMYEELLQLENNPMNLNSVTREQLENFPLLSMEEVDAIARFLEKNRPVYTLFELRNVPYIDIKTVEMILPFFYVGETERKDAKTTNMLKNGRHEAQFRLDKTLTPRAGYGEFSDSILERYPNRKYTGEDFYTSLRYSFRYRNKIQMGITAEKDAGEPFFKPGYPKGYDHYGVHLIINNTGRLKTIALGDYRLSFGQGLVLNNDFMISKSWGAENIVRRTQLPKRHFSTAENNFFRGAATVVEAGNFAFTAFYSNKRIDANLSGDGNITSFKTDGLHRTPSELSEDKRKNTREQVTGGNVNFRRNRLQLGVSALFHKYDRMYNPTLRTYNFYYLRDSSNFNASIDYSYQLPGLIIAGETAITKNGAIATLNALQYRVSGNLSFSLLHRYYPISYNALYAQAFSDGSNVRNEQGLYIGARFRPFSKFSATAYADFVRFPWLKDGVDTPSAAVDLYLLGTYTLSRQSLLEVRYKYKQKEKNIAWPDEKSRSVLPYATHKFRLRYSLDLRSGWNLRTTADAAHYRETHFPAENGWMISQNIGYRGKGALTGDAYLAWFDADTYDARLYSYERNLLSTFYMPSFYGKGYRFALSVKYAITSRLSFSVKAGHTRYRDRDTIGSGTEQINGNSRTDLFSYLRWVF